ncbi:CrcB family protein [Sporolactobacillus sp. CPB3-1]|uniref:Fluoride-specific ion channel FluC n=1 Tax=Sporolactobacillus mangiferae TaxID=2940498 RepID=A0ABT0M9X4_9BACL|nr:CrcB family protein [Sporolactobacillus mangiferae]MCL1631670.1 CrcB family protein [Sporolactobacillus mangiferae]
MHYLLLIAFGILGALSRYTVECLIPGAPFPLATFFINITGCFAITLFARSSRFFRYLSDEYRYLISTGFIGSFTTLSAFLLEVVTLVHHGHLLLAAFYYMATMLSGLAACALGVRVSHMIVSFRRERQ